MTEERLAMLNRMLNGAPVHLAALPSVCKAWRGVMQEITWQQLCLEIAPGLCERMGYDVTDKPPGGWLALLKLLLYCPGMRFDRGYINKDGEEGGFLELMGHVQGKVCGFQTGRVVAKDLLLKEPFQHDCLFVTPLCRHAWLDRDKKLAVCACRGMVWDFPYSAIAKESGAIRYVEASPQEQQLMSSAAKCRCTYCGTPVFVLQEVVFFNIQEKFRHWWQRVFDRCLPDWSDITGQVCGNGHLTFEVFGKRSKRAPFLSGKPMAGSGQGLVVETSGVIKKVYKELMPEPLDFCELDVCRNLNPYTLSRKLTRLATEIRDFVWDECEDGEGMPEELGCVDNFNTMSDVIEWIPRLETRINEIIQIYNNSTAGIYKDSSDKDSFDRRSESAEDEEFCEELPFWRVPWADLGVVKRLQDTSVTGRAAQTIGGYLCHDTSSAKIVVSANIRLDRLCSFQYWAERRLERYEKERKEEIEAALTEAGLQKRGGDWPFPEGVQSYIKDPNVPLEDAIDRQQQFLLKEKEKRAAERAQRRNETALRRAEQEAKVAERKALRERKKAAERVFRASQGLVVCRGTSDGKSCNNLGSEACALSACGNCCRTYTMGVVCGRHRRLRIADL
ncbi:hypothetical protein KFL_000910160 [Klebsormidium nitens]|uniref:F-box domain-containing protein n=1 Tax=Klebsormidium nitens TaxID=105231 RepID=A0A1Y1HZ54_KLENI|nr:hypothetical protein KFL_000910160 [Klebsormidium nitens]|eukprot:GAQ81796.1 hypothetical protein KFL_000910160 [Klebsormidium nitens]